MEVGNLARLQGERVPKKGRGEKKNEHVGEVGERERETNIHTTLKRANVRKGVNVKK